MQTYLPKPRATALLLADVFLMATVIALTPTRLSADTIYLKNGHRIIARVSNEDNKHVTYESEGGEFSIPSSMVDHIEKGPIPGDEAPLSRGRTRAISPGDLPLPANDRGLPAGDVPSQNIIENAVDQARLAQLDGDALRSPSIETRHRLAQGYHEAATFLTKQGDPEAAIDLYRHALKFAPDDPGLTLALGYMLVKQTHYNDAVAVLIPAEIEFPKIPDIPLLLGSAYYSLEHLDRAIEEWKKALAMQESPPLREALVKAEKEKEASSSFEEIQSIHFLLRYDGSEAKGLGQRILGTLEDAFRDLELDLDYYPRESIVVLVYSKDAFRDITRTPDWVGAMNDGKIRVPVSGLATVTPELTRLLRHELTHSFVHLITHDRCPVWFNEGLAQLEEGASTAQSGSRLARQFSAGHTPSYKSLESSFMNLPPDQVILAYAKALAGLEYIREIYGMVEIRQLLKSMPTHSDFPALLQRELRLDYPGFEQEVASYLVKRYGS